ncbi:ATP-dependent DNA helicase, partial [Rothia kristinae]|uniref:ATP-dependent DNA helicase n=1 Tax=Rothia kristinae TaxID=37923 RepID=UPI0034010B2A
TTPAASEGLSCAGEALEQACSGRPAELMPQGLEPGIARAMEQVRDAARAALSDTKADAKDSDAGRQTARAKLTEVLELAERMLSADGRFEVVWISRAGGWEPGRGYVSAADTDPAALHVAPLSVAGRLREGLFQDRTVVLTSATLAIGDSFDQVAGSLGLQGEKAPAWEGLDVGSPFDYPKQGMLYVARDLPKPGRGVSEEQLERILQLVEASGGGALGLFSSRRGAQQAAEYVREHSDLPVLVQGESSLRGLVERFTAEEDTCLFGTMSLWQGVDVPGPSCRLVLIDRIPFPRPDDPLATARARAVGRRGGNGFMAVSAYHAAIRLAQGAGRLIRSREDRGVVAVLDSRLATARYGGFLRAALPPLWTTDRLPVVTGALRRLHAG